MNQIANLDTNSDESSYCSMFDDVSSNEFG